MSIASLNNAKLFFKNKKNIENLYNSLIIVIFKIIFSLNLKLYLSMISNFEINFSDIKLN